MSTTISAERIEKLRVMLENCYNEYRSDRLNGGREGIIGVVAVLRGFVGGLPGGEKLAYPLRDLLGCFKDLRCGIRPALFAPVGKGGRRTLSTTESSFRIMAVLLVDVYEQSGLGPVRASRRAADDLKRECPKGHKTKGITGKQILNWRKELKRTRNSKAEAGSRYSIWREQVFDLDTEEGRASALRILVGEIRYAAL